MTKVDDKKFKKPTDLELRNQLTPLQYAVTQNEGTERPFDNIYNANTKSGIYVDVVSGEPLFSSKDKYDSGTGWPSFSNTITKDVVVLTQETDNPRKRIEVKSKHALSHLGHVFDDGPTPTGLRYCINSASLRFIAKEDLEKEGYGEYKKIFE